MATTTALRYHSFGKPNDVLKIEKIDLQELGHSEVLIKVLAAPINPADFGRIGGSYGELAELPATAGLEGVGEIVSLGDSVSSFQIGQRVFIPGELGSWQTHVVADSKKLFPAPDKLSLENAAMGWVNPATAWLLLKSFAELRAGDWLVQNAATSAVGKLVIEFSRHLGYKTINLVRSLDAADSLKKNGANIVLLDDEDAAKKALEATGGKKARLALNSVGAASVYTQCKLLQNACPLVTFGAMDRELAPFPTRYLIFNDIRLRGFWVSDWYKKASRQEVLDLHNAVFSFMENAKISMDLAGTFPLDQWAKALEASQAPGKPGKVLFLPNG